MREKKINRPIILGIVGDSATGKTTISEGIAEILGAERCTVICIDDYHKYSRQQRADNEMSALDPKGNYVDIFEQHLSLMRQGQPILKPVYNHQRGELDAPEYIQPKDFVICEGLLGYASRQARDCFDVKIFLDPQEDLRVKWKIHRDTHMRGYSREEVRVSLEKRKGDSPAFIEPQRVFADMVIRFHEAGKQRRGDDQHLNVNLVLRPTLPHPDLSPLLDEAGSGDLHLELARDRDGKPVDVLEINGALRDDQAEKMEDLLWSLVPEAGHLRTHVGTFEGNDGQSKSHPLALTQLLVAYHMVKAEHGVHAI